MIPLFNGLASLGPQTQAGSGVAVFAHIGGFLCGALLVWIFRRPERVDRMKRYHAAIHGPPTR